MFIYWAIFGIILGICALLVVISWTKYHFNKDELNFFSYFWNCGYSYTFCCYNYNSKF